MGECVIMRDIEYSNMQCSAQQIMKSQLMITAIFYFEVGYPFNVIKPTVSVVLNRQIYEENVKKFKSMSNRSEQMLIEHALSKNIGYELKQCKLGSNQLIRCVNLIQSQMEIILENESNCRHSHSIYD